MSEDLGGMTLADIEQVAARLEAAARTYREAMALFGPARIVLPAGSPTPTPTGPMQALHGLPGPMMLETPERAEYRQQVANGTAHETPTLPHLQSARDARKAFLAQARNSPERQEKLEQFKHDDGGDNGRSEDA